MAKAICLASKRPGKLHLANGRRHRIITFLLNRSSHSRNAPDALSIVLKYRNSLAK
ncbi:hypothetical protein SAMN05216404_10825 [Nitrosospira multiformis]|uniref:Uncharacterized protein n=1 Tax=Nitrosospira multiformis TaxID=1231 RepID=A0A1H8K4J9_9PROT|nr:hypothetical protein SAMN05216404_10825 [Nitrosospira multiformis]